MGISLANQTSVFLFSCALGFGLGLLYDVFRITRAAINPGRIFIFFQDAIYWILCAIITFLFMLTVNSGEIRGFVLVGELAGGILYYCTLGYLIMKSTKAIIKAIKSVLRFIFKTFIRPLLRLFRKIYRVFSKKVGKVVKKSKKTKANIKYSLKRNGLVLYNLVAKKKKNKKPEQERPHIKPK